MTLRQLQILRAVMRGQTTMAAAGLLGMSQPAVSNAIKQIESQVGFALFERVNNRLYPTDAARQIQEESEPLFAMYAVLERRLEDLRDDKASRLRVVSTPPLGRGAIPVALQRFARRHPRVRVSFDVRELDTVVRAVESGDADLGFGLGLDGQPTLALEPLFQGRMVCVCHPEHPLARRAVVTPAELQAGDLVALHAGTRMGAAVRAAFAASRQPFRFAVSVQYCDTACDLAQAGLGPSVVDPFSPSGGGRPGLAVRPFEPAIPSVAFAVWSARRELPRTAQRFLAGVRQVLDETVAALPAQAMG